MKTLKRASNFAIALSIIVLASCGSKPNYNVSLKKDVDSAGYYLGVLWGQSMKAQPGGEELNIDALAKGLLEGMKSDVADSIAKQKMAAAQSYLQKYFTEAQDRLNKANLEKAQAFMEENKTKEGVVTMPSGLQYRIITEGKGVKPAADDQVQLVYHGTLPDGTVFDSSKDRGDTVTFVPSRMIPGFKEALELMPEGSVWEVYIPAELGYGERVQPGGPIPANSALIFEINAVKVLPSPPAPPTDAPSSKK